MKRSMTTLLVYNLIKSTFANVYPVACILCLKVPPVLQ